MVRLSFEVKNTRVNEGSEVSKSLLPLEACIVTSQALLKCSAKV